MRRTDEFSRWLRKLKDPVGAGLIISRVDRLDDGHAGDSGPVGDGVRELRIHYGPGYRVYFTPHEGEIVVLCGGTKGSQKRDIERAKKLAGNL